MAVEADLGDFDNNLWVGRKPTRNLGWQDGNQELLEVYARDLNHRIERLQASIRGYLARRDSTNEGDYDATTQSSSHPKQASNLKAKSKPNSQLYRQAASGNEGDSDNDADNHRRGLSKGPSEHLRDEDVRGKRDGLLGDLYSRGNRDLEDIIVWPLSAEEQERAHLIETYFLENSALPDKSIDELPYGWSLSWNSSGEPLFTDPQTCACTGQHPNQRYANLVYGKSFDLAHEWKQHNSRMVPSPTMGNRPAPNAPSIGELALEASGKCDGTIAEWWIETPTSYHDDGLCTICRHIDFSKLLFSYAKKKAVLRPIQTIREEIECPFCCLIIRCASVALPHQTIKDLGNQKTIVPCSVTQAFRAGIVVSFDDVHEKDRPWFGSIYQLYPDEEISEMEGYSGHLTVDDQINCKLVKSWLLDCDQHHSEVTGDSPETDGLCAPFAFHQAATSCLTVINVQRGCLVDVPPDVRYIALSYVWGGPQPFTNLRSRNETLHEQDQFPLDADILPETIRDAIYFVRLLGESYLWVDSLCIVQDDELQKAVQIANMGNIFSRAYFTIIAAYGNSCHAGLPGARPGSRNTAQRKEHIQGMLLANGLPSYRTIIEPSRWNSRGWTYQESELCTRYVIFSEYQAFYRCNQRICSETSGLRTTEYSRQYTYKIHVTEAASFLSYSDAVRNYTKRTLGKIQDIVDAFQGMTTLMQPLFKGRFLCGLPETELDIALLWQPRSDTLHRRIDVSTGKAMFPSWSWAGWVGSFCYLKWTDHMLDDLSRVQWQDANTGQFFTSDEFRSPKDGPTFKYNDCGERGDDWTACRTHERFVYDMPYWYEHTTPKIWCLHPTAPEAERTPRTFLHLGSQTLRFKALTAFFQLSVSSTWSGFAETAPLRSVGILDRDNFRAGTIHIHDDLLSQLKLGPSSTTEGEKSQMSHFELICLSRRRASEWDSTCNNVYETDPYYSPQPSDDFKNIPDQPTLYPDQKTPEEADDGFDHRRYNVHMPFPLYNVMLIARKGGKPDGIAERVAIGTIHVTAFLQAKPEWKLIELA